MNMVLRNALHVEGMAAPHEDLGVVCRQHNAAADAAGTVELRLLTRSRDAGEDVGVVCEQNETMQQRLGQAQQSCLLISTAKRKAPQVHLCINASMYCPRSAHCLLHSGHQTADTPICLLQRPSASADCSRQKPAFVLIPFASLQQGTGCASCRCCCQCCIVHPPAICLSIMQKALLNHGGAHLCVHLQAGWAEACPRHLCFVTVASLQQISVCASCRCCCRCCVVHPPAICSSILQKVLHNHVGAHHLCTPPGTLGRTRPHQHQCISVQCTLPALCAVFTALRPPDSKYACLPAPASICAC
jgi:hypothetical protein